MLRAYPQYTLKDVFNKSFKDGGLTRGQIAALFEEADKAAYEKMRHEAFVYSSIMIHGKDPDDLSKPERKALVPEKTNSGEKLDVPTEEEVARMTNEERKALTKKMMEQHNSFVFGESNKNFST